MANDMRRMGNLFGDLSVIIRAAKQLLKERCIKTARVFFFRGLLCPKCTADWTRYVDHLYGKYNAGRIPAFMLQKITRSYVDRQWGAVERLRRLCAHYNLAQDIFSAEDIRQMLKGERVHIAELKGKSERYALYLQLAHIAHREGEFSVELQRVDSLYRLAKITFLFHSNPNGEKILMIGGLQGASFGVPKDLIVKATRDMFGLRPKQGVLEFVRYLAAASGCDEIWAVSNKNHVIAGKANYFRPRKIFADYDNFWLERGAELHPSGNYKLPMADVEFPTAEKEHRRFKIRHDIAAAAMSIVRTGRAA